MGEHHLPPGQAHASARTPTLNLLAGALGLLGLGLLLADMTTTTLSTRGSGWLAGRVARGVWRAALALQRRRERHELLGYVGAAIVIVTFVLWVMMLWLSWGLIFLADPGAVVESDGQPARWPQVLYFVGYTLITLGNGEFRPEGDVWRMMTLIAATSGFFVVTLAITYLLSVLPAVANKRQVATYLADLGGTPEALALRIWADGRCSGLDTHLTPLMQGVGTLAQQHLAYPVVHYFHATDPRAAFPLRLVALDEALSLVVFGLACPDVEGRLEPLRSSIAGFLDAHHGGFFGAATEPPPPPSLAALRAAGLPVRDEAAFAEALREVTERRKRLLSLVEQDGWRWEQIGSCPPPWVRRARAARMTAR